MAKHEKEKSNRVTLGRVLYLVILVILIIVAYYVYGIYKSKNFNEFVRTEYKLYTSEFIRDSNVKYSNIDSYKITSKSENDAMFYKTIAVTPNTPYKVTCMVKTKDVKTVKEISKGGAHISIADTVEKSRSIVGTNDWQKLEFIFNSKDRTNVNIGFRLGGYDDNCTGTAWFSDFSIEVGAGNTDTNWKFACFVFENTNVEFEKNGQVSKANLNMSVEDIMQMKQNMSRFRASCEELSNNKMQISYDFIIIQDPIKSLTYDDENGYYVAPENVKEIIQPYLEKNIYDHIFVCVRLGDNIHKNDIPVYDWIGLGGMDYLGVGFSNIRLPNNDKSYAYKYDARVNTFPEEVFIHEFLHTLERNSKEYGYEVPKLHDYAKYGYKDESLIGLKNWYQDYMNCRIKTNSGYIGLPLEIYRLKPNNEENFKFSYKLNGFEEPKNIIEEIKMIITKAVNNVEILTTRKAENAI